MPTCGIDLELTIVTRSKQDSRHVQEYLDPITSNLSSISINNAKYFQPAEAIQLRRFTNLQKIRTDLALYSCSSYFCTRHLYSSQRDSVLNDIISLPKLTTITCKFEYCDLPLWISRRLSNLASLVMSSCGLTNGTFRPGRKCL